MVDSPGGRGGFLTTRWSLIVAAQQKSDGEALSALCELYWYPVYAFIRRQGCSAADAEDLTQGFFARVLEKNWVNAADRERGRFRSFLLGSLKNFLSHERERAHAQKRGGEARHVALESFDADSAEQLFQRDLPTADATPEELFDRRCALQLLDTALEELRAEWIKKGEQKKREYEILVPFLEGSPDADYESSSVELGITPGNARVKVKRMRDRFREILRQLVAATVAPGDADVPQVDDEIRHLINAVARH